MQTDFFELAIARATGATRVRESDDGERHMVKLSTLTVEELRRLRPDLVFQARREAGTPATTGSESVRVAEDFYEEANGVLRDAIHREPAAAGDAATSEARSALIDYGRDKFTRDDVGRVLTAGDPDLEAIREAGPARFVSDGPFVGRYHGDRAQEAATKLTPQEQRIERGRALFASG